jgi:hypothetical protein
MTTSPWKAALTCLLACSLPSCGGSNQAETKQTSSAHQKDGRDQAPEGESDAAQDGSGEPQATGGSSGDGQASPSGSPGSGQGSGAPAPTDPQTPPDASPTTAEPACSAPEGVSNDPRSIEEVITLINALPMPVTLPCYFEALRRPLYLSASSSQLSVQPAVSELSPRMFLFGGPLVTALAPEGEGSHLLELSVLLSDQTSIKGEISFPVAEALPLDAAYKGILRNDGNGTRCAGCHFNEAKATGPLSASAYTSTALRPFADSDVPIDFLAAESGACAKNTSERCRMLRALFEHGQVLPKAFPAGMDTLF